jgi:DNA mismatch repair protein MutL
VPNLENDPGFIPKDKLVDLSGVEMAKVPADFNFKIKNKPHPERLAKRIPGLEHQLDAIKMFDGKPKKPQEPVPDVFEENKRLLENMEKEVKQRKIDVSNLVYVGKAFNTYLFYECEDSIFMIDQHAAHERLIFDKLKEKMRNREIVCQPMLLPYELSVNAVEAAFLRLHLNELAQLGFETVEQPDGLFQVSTIPADLPKIQLSAFFGNILSDLDGYRGIKMEEMLKDKLATAACKAAIKGGMDISKEEIDELLKQMDGNMGLKCPHGRPVVVELSKTEIEKMFKRIV